MKPYHKNPRQITASQFESLGQWMYELGDLSGITHDINTDELITGNQRGKAIDINECEIVIEEEYPEPDRQGTIARGYIVWQGMKYNYRRVDWTPEQSEKANIVANKAGGTWDFDILANEFEFEELIDWGFREDDLFGSGSFVPDFQPTTADEQPRLDERSPVICPHCGLNIHDQPD